MTCCFEDAVIDSRMHKGKHERSETATGSREQPNQQSTAQPTEGRRHEKGPANRETAT